MNEFFTAGAAVHRSDLLTVLPRSFVPATGFESELTICPLPFEMPSIDVYGERGGTVLVKLLGEDSEVRLSVENSGPAIPAETLDALFEPLRRSARLETQGERENLGLGLFIVRQVALAHGGHVVVDSVEGRTVFTVTLPKN